MTVVYADWQTAGRGQGSNKWESEAGKNLLFSILVCPTSIDITRQFVLSMAGALAVKAALDKSEMAQRHLLARPQDKRHSDRDFGKRAHTGTLHIRHRTERKPTGVSQRRAQSGVAI